ncbi:MAG: IS5 family transposase [candidate division Zixibacteria bacterium]|nr:IS5 family transposase [candidate division Zixibacteria bacterium]
MARGGITFWIDEAALTTRRNTQARSGSGAPRIYSDTAIHCAVVVKSVYYVSLRAAQGFVSSVMSLLRLDLPVPNYSTICRRQGSLKVPIFSSSNSRPRHIVIDATGLRVYGAGEWHVQKHRGDRRRIWRKLHLGVDEQTKEIVAVEITASHVHDSRVLPRLLMQISGKVCQVSGDGAYDTKACYESIGQRGAKATTPPRRNAKRMRCSTPPKQLAIRDANLRQNSTARPVCLARSQWLYTTELGGECRVSVQGYLWFQVQGAPVR